jgi:ABC-type Fe3+ transport system permease subunit
VSESLLANKGSRQIMFNNRKEKISREEWIKEAMAAADEATRAEEARYKAEREVKRRQKLRRIIIRVLALFLVVLLLTMVVQAFSKEPMTRFFFNHWGMFVLVSAILILLSIAVSKTIDFLYPEGRYPKRHIEKSRPESVEIISKIAWIVFVATPILLGIIVNSSFLSAWSWWTIESIPQMHRITFLH